MKIWLMGVEQQTNLRLTDDYRHVGMSYTSLRKRLPKKKAWTVADRWPLKDVYLALGGAAVNKMPDTEFLAYAQEVVEFLTEHGQHFALVSGIDDKRAPIYTDQIAPLCKYSPVWFPDLGVEMLDHLARGYDVVSLRAEDCRTSPMLSARLAPLRARHGTDWHVLDGARPDDLMTGRFQSAATVAWLSPMKYGETIVWDGVRMQRYPERMKGIARPRHRSAFTRAGFDADKILEGDHEEITRFTVWSFAQLESYLDRTRPPKPPTNPFRVVGPDDVPDEVSNYEGDATIAEPDGTGPETVDNSPAVVRNENRIPAVRDEPRKVLPVFDFAVKQEVEIGPDGERIVVDRLLAKKGSAPLRQCDSCVVAGSCPAFQPSAECAYALPIEIRTKEQLSSALAALLEKQMDRVAFMMMQEELNGGYSDPNTGLEVDRLMKMIETMKRVEDNREFIKFQVEAKGQAGVLSRLFGEQAQQLQRFERPIPIAEIESTVED